MRIYNYNKLKNLCGKQIRHFRTQKNLTQEQLAARMQVRGVNLGRESIIRIEKGRRFVSDYELCTFSEVFGVNIYDLMGKQPP